MRQAQDPYKRCDVMWLSSLSNIMFISVLDFIQQAFYIHILVEKTEGLTASTEVT